MKTSFGRSYTVNLTQGFQSLGAALLYNTRRQRVRDTIFAFFNYQEEGRTLITVATTSINLPSFQLTYEVNKADPAPTHGNQRRISGN
jgi:hypothetical protein